MDEIENNPSQINIQRPGSGAAVGSESYSQLNPPVKTPSFKDKVGRILATLGIITAGTPSAINTTHAIKDVATAAVNTTIEAKNQLGLLPEQKSALELYKKYQKESPEKILNNIAVINPKGTEPVNGRNMPDVAKPNSIIKQIPVGTIFDNVIRVTGINPDLTPERRSQLENSTNPADKELLKSTWYAVIENNDVTFFNGDYGKPAELSQLNPLNPNYPGK